MISQKKFNRLKAEWCSKKSNKKKDKKDWWYRSGADWMYYPKDNPDE